MMNRPVEAQHRKHEIRAQARDRRARQPSAEQVSRQIFDRVVALPQYAAADVVMSYMSFHTEVSTREFIARAWSDGKRVVIPYCVEDRLGLFHLQDYDDLSPGTLGILEPKTDLRSHPARHINVAQLDLIIVPGLAFDRQCGRIGYGKGYYDWLMRQVRPEATLVAVAFECQMFPEIPVLPHDIRVDMVVTETAAYVRSRPRWDGQETGAARRDGGPMTPFDFPVP